MLILILKDSFHILIGFSDTIFIIKEPFILIINYRAIIQEPSNFVILNHDFLSLQLIKAVVLFSKNELV